ncbi:trypsin-like peptidase domain-containing protein [Sedimentitalea arenosa]|jgi:Do/DeqQ family serine protease|uniref:Trypsin-like peptidase domain-containing protein n=1 Tax=Sedimentitalea arenosa TaxID=2798803 RepID=A0A8J7ILW2_9RHOB|nr:trypsin-like peptidase domain-containing protein [Arenibacterium arenosum]MBJ6372963.1 trypsin-like peptidase domain-containing protein [Arenibacterium arenosum]
MLIRLYLVALLLASPLSAETRVPQSQAEIALSFVPLVQEAAPAVVNIYARRVIQAQRTPFMNDPFFEDFFRGFGTPQPRVQNSLGSGVILSPDGIVVSNYHVVGTATEINVVLTDRREYNARVLLGDEEADLAILQLEGAEDLPFLSLRNSDQVQVGELVLAIGNPFGIGQTVTSGIVSGLARSGAATGQARGYFIQTDAAINPGNSGGALIDVNGALVGINTSILSRSGGSNGIGFAIPANLVAEFVKQAREGRELFERPWAGMSGQPVNSDLAESLGLSVPDGIVISDLHPASPFAKAGMGVGDVITHVDGQPVNSPQEMIFRMTVAGIDNAARVTWMRDAEEAESEVAMIAAPDEPPAEETRLGQGTVVPELIVARANPAVIARFGLPLATEGVIVTDPGPLGRRVGVQTGDVIQQINGDTMTRSADVVRALTRPGRSLRLDLLRRGQRLSLRFRL